jgi:hypothetical protein
MPKTQSERRRLKGLTVNLFSTNTLLGWNVIRQVTAREALEKIALKKWREVWYENGDLAGVQPLKAEQHKTLGDALTERLIGVTITLNEVQRNAGLFGPSHTIGLPEWKRLKRHARFDDKQILPPEDATERAIEKVRQWPYPASRIGMDDKGEPVFGDRAIRVYPHAPAMEKKA